MQPQVVFDEGPVSISFQGRSFSSHGAVVTEAVCVAYLSPGGLLTSCDGQQLGTYRITSRWPTPRSWISSSCSQVVARIAGRTYHGRSAGVGMIFRGRRSARELRSLCKDH